MPIMQLSEKVKMDALCCGICCVALPSSTQGHSLTSEALAAKKGGEFLGSSGIAAFQSWRGLKASWKLQSGL